MNNRKINTFLRPTRSRMVFETQNLISQLNKLTRDEKHSRVWTWVKQGIVSYQQFTLLLSHLEKNANND